MANKPKVRVLRLLEYEYDSAETMVQDMQHWQVGANATYTPHSHMVVRSATVVPHFNEETSNAPTEQG